MDIREPSRELPTLLAIRYCPVFGHVQFYSLNLIRVIQRTTILVNINIDLRASMDIPSSTRLLLPAISFFSSYGTLFMFRLSPQEPISSPETGKKPFLVP